MYYFKQQLQSMDNLSSETLKIILICELCLQINFLLGADRNPWVWVMGEHPDDFPYEEDYFTSVV